MRSELLLPYPPSVNAIFANRKGGGRVKTAAYRAWIAEAGWTVIAQKDGHNRHTGRVRFTLLVRRPEDNRRRDIGNLEKAVADLLVRQGILADDSLIEHSDVRWVYEGVNGAKVIIEDLNGT